MTPLPVHELIAAQARRTPAAPALRHGETTLSYAALEARATALAHRLAARGVGAETLVAVCLDRSIDFVVTLLAIWKAGGAYLPIDPAYPVTRIDYLCADSGAALVVTTAARAGRFAGHAVLAVDEPGDATAPLAVGDPDALAYVIYTSGSTGQPKGVEITHRALANHNQAIAATFGLGAGDRVLQSASVGFDITGEQLFPALIAGATVVLRPDDLFASFARFSAFVAAEALSVLILPTSFWHEWVGELARTGAPLPASLAVVAVGSEAVSTACLRTWDELAAGRSELGWFQGYGPTEATITATMYRHDGQDFAPGAVVPIGHPLPNVTVEIVDEAGVPVAPGEVGEILIGGAGLARGYRGRPALTAERFIGAGAARRYRTGDFGRRRPDGAVEFFGRRDDQVKVSGVRIELGEIEAALARHPDVKSAVVLAPADPAGGRRLVGFVLPAHGRTPAPAALARWLADKLPPHMLPGALILVPSWPLTANQKIDKQALLAHAERRASESPAGATERALAELWCRILGPVRVGRDDDFFALGGQSLTAIRLAAEIQRRFAVAVPAGRLFEQRTLRAMAALIDAGGATSTADVIALRATGDQPPLFCICGIDIYRPLAEALDPALPVYGVYLASERALLEVEDAVAAGFTVERLAAEYVAAVRTQQPHGPYRLGGISFGGVLALEMAQQLRRAGEAVELVVLFDSLLPGATRPLTTRERLARLVRDVREAGGRAAARRLWQRLIDRLVFRLVFTEPPHRSDAGLRATRDALYVALLAHYERAIAPYAGDVLLFRAQDRRWHGRRDRDDQNGWPAHLRGGFEVHDIPGDHLAILRAPAVAMLAGILQQRLLSARARAAA